MSQQNNVNSNLTSVLKKYCVHYFIYFFIQFDKSISTCPNKKTKSTNDINVYFIFITVHFKNILCSPKIHK